MPQGPLSEFRIIDLSTHIAGPFCARLIADYGADVVKVESPGVGDASRGSGPFFSDTPDREKSLQFLYLNANKRGVTLNLECAAGRALFVEMVKSADAIIESYPPGYLDSLGLGYTHLETQNPGLVMTSVTPFGQTGPYREFLGSPIVYEALGGVMYTSGAYDREPLGHGHPQSLYIGGITAAYATSAALYWRGMSGKGQRIDVSLMEVMAAHHVSPPNRYIYTGAIERRAPKKEAGSAKAGPHFQGIVPVKDGYVGATFQRGTQRPGTFSEYVDLLGHPELASLQELIPQQPNEFPKEWNDALLSILKEWNKFDYFSHAASSSWVAAVVQTSEDLSRSPQLDERGFYSDIEHPVVGKLKMPGEIYKLPKSPYSLRVPAPLLGQHNKEIFCEEMGVPQKDLVMLRRHGVI